MPYSPLNHLLEGVSVCKPCAANANVFLQTEILNLMKNSFDVVFCSATILVGFDSSDV